VSGYFDVPISAKGCERAYSLIRILVGSAAVAKPALISGGEQDTRCRDLYWP